MSEPFTTGFGAVPRPEEPERPGWTPPPVPPHPLVNHWGPGYGPSAQSSVVNQIRIGGGYRRCNHVLHAALTLFTCGLWAPVWFVAWLVSRQH